MNRTLIVLSVLVWSVTFGAVAALAQSLSSSEQAALDARVISFEQAFAKGDMGEVANVIPPKLLNTMATQFGVSPEELIAEMIRAMDQAMQRVSIDTYTMDTNAATVSATAARTYVLIPTETTMSINGTTKVEASSQTLAFADEGTWYLVRIDEAEQVRFLILAYPEFDGIDFPAGSMKIIDE